MPEETTEGTDPATEPENTEGPRDIGEEGPPPESKGDFNNPASSESHKAGPEETPENEADLADLADQMAGINESDTLAEKVDKVLDLAKHEIRDMGRATVEGVIGEGRQLMRVLLKGSELSDKDKARIVAVYESAEELALQGKKNGADQMLLRVRNFLASDEVIQKAGKVEAANDFWSNSLGMLSGIAGAFLNKMRAPLLNSMSDIAASAAEDILG